MSVDRANGHSRFAEGVAKVGFRKWYERELMSSHAHLIVVLFSGIGIFASIEAFRGAATVEKLLDVAFVIACAFIGHRALRRYLFLLMRAEVIANQATCAACAEYGRLKVMSEDPAQNEAVVCCRKCDHRWVIGIGD